MAERLDLVTLREFIEQRMDSMDAALSLRTGEVERRLSELNHVHQRAVEDRSQFLPREVFEQYLREVQSWRDSVNADLNQARGRATMLAAVISLAVGVVVFILNRVWR